MVSPLFSVTSRNLLFYKDFNCEYGQFTFPNRVYSETEKERWEKG